jgi:hypothetical protein
MWKGGDTGLVPATRHEQQLSWKYPNVHGEPVTSYELKLYGLLAFLYVAMLKSGLTLDTIN